uniref:Proteasome subunit alpha type n=1 Tax=Stygiella incarcerata TaxID=1712417 RepID=A0A192ZIL7_9EUKA|nr:proteasome subunit alpha type-4 [Stygiella incarcerata]|eukprot:TRINITY_DN82237_c0_g1_i1.p1 TRINITY_DN82237_c0_g1~~TRINITY_DN82237_c0_g1_i1.p1  ORF type:complete len:248 (-),score=73.43 TRINITY_DN82237_c0_g1_i1:135-878(-)
MSRRYDSYTTIFSPEGRLHQVEYAIEAISHAGACIGVLATDGVVLAAEKKIISKLLDSQLTEKMYKIDDHLACAVAGMTADANILINRARLGAQDHLQMFEEPVPVEELINSICNVKHAYTQYGGLRPFGVSFLFAGWDRYNGFQLYASDPSGNYGAWKASAIGANHQTAQNVLKENWTEDLDIEGAIRLTVKVLSKTMDSTSLTSEKLEFATLTQKDGKTVFHVLCKEEVADLLKRHEDLFASVED